MTATRLDADITRDLWIWAAWAGTLELERRYSVYIMASQRNGTLYVGVTNHLGARAFQHRNGVGSQFTAKYGVKTLVWYEHYGDVRDAIAREKQLKKWERRWKLELIEAFNPDWRDLYETLNT